MSNLVVQTNVLALNSHRNLTQIGKAQAQASARLSSGYRINSAADDAAGLAISESMRAQIRGLNQANTNAQDGQSMMQTAEGGLDQVDSMIQRIRELVVQSANDTNYDTSGAASSAVSIAANSTGLYSQTVDPTGDRGKIDLEIAQLTAEIYSMSSRVQFNHKNLLDGSLANQGVSFQVGANSAELIDATKPFSMANLIEIGNMLSGVYANGGSTSGITAGLSSNQISSMLSGIDNALTQVVAARAMFGAIENRLNYTEQSLSISSDNLSSAESLVKDTDMAQEMMNLTAANVLQQAGVSMLSQANQNPQAILRLLQ